MSEITPELLRRMEIKPTLSNCERVIERAVYAYAEAGGALETICKRKLFRQAGYKSFEVYVKERWGWTRQHAYHQIDAAKVHDALYDRAKTSTIVDTFEPPRNEGTARELVPLRKKPKQLVEVWTSVVEKHGPDATAAQTRKFVAEVLPKASPNGATPERTTDDAVLALRRMMDNGYEIKTLRRALDLIDPDGRTR